MDGIINVWKSTFVLWNNITAAAEPGSGKQCGAWAGVTQSWVMWCFENKKAQQSRDQRLLQPRVTWTVTRWSNHESRTFPHQFVVHCLFIILESLVWEQVFLPRFLKTLILKIYWHSRQRDSSRHNIYLQRSLDQLVIISPVFVAKVSLSSF